MRPKVAEQSQVGTERWQGQMGPEGRGPVAKLLALQAESSTFKCWLCPILIE